MQPAFRPLSVQSPARTRLSYPLSSARSRWASLPGRALHVAVGGVDVGEEQLGVDRVGARGARCARRAGPSGTSPFADAPGSRCARSRSTSSTALARTRARCSGEVGSAPARRAATARRARRRSRRSIRAGRRAGHCSTSMSCGIDAHVLNGRLVGAHGRARLGPAERRLVVAQPQLQRLGRGRRARARPSRATRGRSSISSPQTIGAMPSGMAKHDDVEVLAAAQDARLGVGPVAEVRLERRVLDARRRVELLDERASTGSRAGRRSAPAARSASSPGARRAWRPNGHGVDRASRSRREVQPVDAVEELEAHARGRAAPGRAGRRRRRPCPPPSSRRSRRGTRRTSSCVRKTATPGAHAAARSRGAAVGEDEVVEPADEREVGHLRRRAVAGDPVEEVLVVERAEAAAAGDDARRRACRAPPRS